MTTRNTAYGTLEVLSTEALFSRIHELMEEASATAAEAAIGLTGGSTPKAFYRWAAERTDIFSPELREKAVWSVSDERMVSLEHPESNFGNADRLFLRALRIAEDRKIPFPVSVDPHSAGIAFSRKWQERQGEGKVFDLCFLGMGDDGHTASLFPGGPVPAMGTSEPFVCVEVPEKGWRLTITPAGLAACSRIVVVVTGENKRERLQSVLEGPDGEYPIQLLKPWADKVTWLVDPAAVGEDN